jgi:hypothetical protein
MVSWFVPQNQVGGLSVASQNRREDVTAWDTRRDLAVYFTWKQVWVGFSNLALRLTETRRWVVHVALSRRLRRSQIKDGRVDATGYIRLYYPCFIVFFLLDPKGIIVI